MPITISRKYRVILRNQRASFSTRECHQMFRIKVCPFITLCALILSMPWRAELFVVAECPTGHDVLSHWHPYSLRMPIICSGEIRIGNGALQCPWIHCRLKRWDFPFIVCHSLYLPRASATISSCTSSGISMAGHLLYITSVKPKVGNPRCGLWLANAEAR